MPLTIRQRRVLQTFSTILLWPIPILYTHAGRHYVLVALRINALVDRLNMPREGHEFGCEPSMMRSLDDSGTQCQG
ncbi:hypothetical protein BD310DRAFT_266769 [Dichomitus squalens]|uniref:Uncharacterized protein n=1 Tax=Dichomitus squalens TaxID=114155 RepID=A0A4Q9Q1A7_9APHY|nr:hypothetical protein BD310DRAFT_266769 [Dichomitus squalens]